ncbi:copper resistance protein B [Profundibacterium mesophilum]|uniref:Copper-binding protein n=1 Tax=Profundibacterium mesophilum KAUST100406-0324 TaxID=1037889 RepID=A0A921NUN3_9RHOB|nr:copper resistance protein B [Profundibacterium mesophilum]KAF0675888.1 putative Copper-binding protein [Profundibacterium mesophilum KAUST100406-0324]
MKRFMITFLAAGFAGAAFAQTASGPEAVPMADPMAGHDMSSMTQMQDPGSSAADCDDSDPSASGGTAGVTECDETPPAAPMAGHDMNAMDDMEGMDHGAMTGGETSERSAAPADPMEGHDMGAMEGMDHGAMTGGETSERSAAPAAPMAGHDMGAMEGMDHGAMTGAETSERSAAPAAPMAGHDMGAMDGMDHGAMTGSETSEASAAPADPMAGHDMGAMEGMDHGAMTGGAAAGDAMAGHDMGAMNAPEIADAPPPAAAFSGPAHAADLYYGDAVMARSREHLDEEMGDVTAYKFLLDQLEIRPDGDESALNWDGQAWYGGDINKLWVKTEGELTLGESLESGEIQLLWNRTVTPWADLQTGLRYDFGEDADRAHFVLGVQSLLPYFYELEAAAFLSDEGDVTARAEAEYDMLLTQKLILQPSAEIELSAQDIPELGIGAGVTGIEAGLRLRYEIVPEFAPYIGVTYDRLIGETADLAGARGEDKSAWSGVIGVRMWF